MAGESPDGVGQGGSAVDQDVFHGLSRVAGRAHLSFLKVVNVCPEVTDFLCTMQGFIEELTYFKVYSGVF